MRTLMVTTAQVTTTPVTTALVTGTRPRTCQAQGSRLALLPRRLPWYSSVYRRTCAHASRRSLVTRVAWERVLANGQHPLSFSGTRIVSEHRRGRLRAQTRRLQQIHDERTH